MTMQKRKLNAVADLISLLKAKPQTVEFEQVMAVINDSYYYSPTAFTNGELLNQAGTNEGSCKIFAFAQLNQLTQQETLACFGRYYREDVLVNPKGDDHANIRNFITTSWQGIEFKGVALQPTPLN